MNVEGDVVGLFGTRTVRSHATPTTVSQEAPAGVRGVPVRFEAVGEALIAGVAVEAACAVVGRDLARDGVDLGEALTGLRFTYELVSGADPAYDAVQAFCVAWSEETLGYLHQVSCENPMTGLASLAHLRARLAEIQRGAEGRGSTAAASHALVVIDFPGPDVAQGYDARLSPGVFARSLQIARLADRIRLVFDGEETVSQVSPQRLVVLTSRTPNLAIRAITVREFAEEVIPGAHAWVEGLPSSSAGIAALLSELARAYSPF